MAKIYDQKKDRYGMWILYISSIILLGYFGLAAFLAIKPVYFLYGVIAALFMGEAIHGRFPNMYPDASTRRILFSVMGASLMGIFIMFYILVTDPRAILQLIVP